MSQVSTTWDVRSVLEPLVEFADAIDGYPVQSLLLICLQTLGADRETRRRNLRFACMALGGWIAGLTRDIDGLDPVGPDNQTAMRRQLSVTRDGLVCARAILDRLAELCPDNVDAAQTRHAVSSVPAQRALSSISDCRPALAHRASLLSS